MPRSLSTRALSCATCLASFASAAAAQTTTRVSVDSHGVQGNFDSGDYGGLSISADGRFVAFQSYASNLVAGDTNGTLDVFVHDRQSGTTERVSVDSNGVEGNYASGEWGVSISADGRFVAFSSVATNLVPGGTSGYQIFVHDRWTGATELVSVDSSGAQGNFASQSGVAISADGRFMAFQSYASNLVAGDTNGKLDVFVRDRQSGTTERVSVDSNGVQANDTSGQWGVSISADGRYVAFPSNATNLVSGDTNGTWDVFVHDRWTGATERVSVDSSGMEGNNLSNWTSISADGRYVAFPSYATNLVPGDTNGTWDVFVHDCQSGTTERLSVDSNGAQGNGDSGSPSISADGRFVAFTSGATNLIPGDTNNVGDVFVHDRQSGMTERVSTDSNGVQGNGDSFLPSLSADGSSVAFASYATDLVAGDTNSEPDVFLFERTCLEAVSTYCAAKTNSLGCLPSIGSLGVPSQSGTDNFFVTASNVRNNKLGMMIWSLTQDSQPFFGGTLCLHSPIKRTPGQSSGGSASGDDCTGTYSYHFTQAYMLQQLLGANTTVYAQYWSRDPGFAPPNNVGLTNGLQFTICP